MHGAVFPNKDFSLGEELMTPTPLPHDFLLLSAMLLVLGVIDGWV